MDKPAVLKQNYNHWEITKDLIDQCIDITLKLSQSGHPGGSLSAADILVALYFEIMNILSQEISVPPEYGLDRDSEGNVITPISLVKVNTNRFTPIPTFGFSLDF